MPSSLAVAQGVEVVGDLGDRLGVLGAEADLELTARSDYPQLMLRQFDAVSGTGSLLRYARVITATTAIIHGSEDPLVRPRNGRNLARAMHGTHYVQVEGMATTWTNRCGGQWPKRSSRTSGGPHSSSSINHERHRRFVLPPRFGRGGRDGVEP